MKNVDNLVLVRKFYKVSIVLTFTRPMNMGGNRFKY